MDGQIEQQSLLQTTAPDHALIFTAYLKEAEFLRAEALQCIGEVRRLTVFATTVAGVSLPVLAGLLSHQDGRLTVTSWAQFIELIRTNALLVQFVCLGVALTCFALLRIYLGTFQQIFSFARYFREHLSPAMNNHLGQGSHAPVMFWEEWLRRNRSKSRLHVGDADLAAEPILIALYCLAYLTLFTVIGISAQTFPITSLAVCLVLTLFILVTLTQFFRVLAKAVA